MKVELKIKDFEGKIIESDSLYDVIKHIKNGKVTIYYETEDKVENLDINSYIVDKVFNKFPQEVVKENKHFMEYRSNVK